MFEIFVFVSFINLIFALFSDYNPFSLYMGYLKIYS